jgi:hypothetical protein
MRGSALRSVFPATHRKPVFTLKWAAYSSLHRSNATNQEMNMNTSKTIAAAAAVLVNLVIGVSVYTLFSNESPNSNVQVAKIESITVIGHRA